jgi:AAA family ATP:ADP antiporter
MASPVSEMPRKTWLERALSIFSNIRREEVATTLLLTLTVYMLLSSYYFLKPARDAFLLGTKGGAEVKSYSSAGQAMALLLVIPLYSVLASKVNRIRLIVTANLFFMANMGLFYVLAKREVPVGVPFYIWVGIYNYFVVSQLWGFANDIHTEEQGKRIFPVVGIGGSIGALSGSVVFGRLLKQKWFTVDYAMLVAAALLGVATLAIYWVHLRTLRVAPSQRAQADKPVGASGAFQLVFTNRYLLLLAVLTVVLNFVNTTGGYLFDKKIEEAAFRAIGEGDHLKAERKRFVGAYSSDFLSGVNLLGLFMQTFLASRILKYMGVRGAMFILPAIACVGYSTVVLFPILRVLRWTKTLENSTDYSIQNTARQALYLLTSREAKYKAKVAIDTFMVRVGDMFQALAVYGVVGVLHRDPWVFAKVNVVASLIWLGVVVLLTREHRKLEQAAKEAAAPVRLGGSAAPAAA